MAGDDFSERLGQIAAAIGVGDLVGSVEVDQVYAHYQHEGICRFCGRPLVYHRGGGSHYLSKPLMERHDEYYENVARELLDEHGGGALRAMKKNVENLASWVAELAPLESSNLRRSAHPTVTEAGTVVYDRKPDQPRLSPSELAAQRKARGHHAHTRGGH